MLGKCILCQDNSFLITSKILAKCLSLLNSPKSLVLSCVLQYLISGYWYLLIIIIILYTIKKIELFYKRQCLGSHSDSLSFVLHCAAAFFFFSEKELLACLYTCFAFQADRRSHLSFMGNPKYYSYIMHQ